MSTFDQLVNEITQTLHGFGLAQPRAAYLTASADADDLTFTVSDSSSFGQGLAEIENELVFVLSKDDTANTLTIAPDGRGYYGTTAATHAINKRIDFAPAWSRNRIAAAINEAIINTYPTLWATGSTEFNFNPSISTYEIPADAERILKVTAETIGPSQDQPMLTRYSFNSTTAATDDIDTTNSITLGQAPFPGRPVTVTYAKRPVEITFGDDFTDSGLAESAKTCVKYAACSLLLAYIDAARLPVGTAQADEYDPSKNGIGSASRLSVQLYQRYQLELEQERKRLRAATPAIVTFRSR